MKIQNITGSILTKSDTVVRFCVNNGDDPKVWRDDGGDVSEFEVIGKEIANLKIQFNEENDE